MVTFSARPYAPRMSSSSQRVIALLVLLVAGVVSLPVVAYFFDGQGSENWIIPIELLVMALLGAVVGRALPGLAGEGATGVRAMVVGAIVGVVASFVGVVLFFLLISGFDGA